MEKNKYFYQDFLMDFPYDENEYPIVDVKYIDTIDNIIHIDEETNLFDLINDKFRKISFKIMHNQTKIDWWLNLFEKIKQLDGVIIEDDLTIQNVELLEMKRFYMLAYYYNIQKFNKNVYIYSKSACF